MNPFESLEDAVAHLRSVELGSTEILLPVSDGLNDPMGMHMAIIADAALQRGLEPDGFEQQEGYRVYRYKT